MSFEDKLNRITGQLDRIENELNQEPGDKCPRCGGELIYGFGLCGGGYGAYTFCGEDHCDYFVKKQEEDES
jgi:hypothetical protein